MLLTISVSTALGLAAVGIHYETFRLTSGWVDRPAISPRFRVALSVLLALVAHLLEASIFAVAWGLMALCGHPGTSVESPGIADDFYFSIVTYTSLGYGDIVPVGPSRILAGVEALVGVVLIAWTASFTYFQMRRHWHPRED